MYNSVFSVRKMHEEVLAFDAIFGGPGSEW